MRVEDAYHPETKGMVEYNVRHRLHHVCERWRQQSLVWGLGSLTDFIVSLGAQLTDSVTFLVRTSPRVSDLRCDKLTHLAK